jgi:hypothetical protein
MVAVEGTTGGEQWESDMASTAGMPNTISCWNQQEQSLFTHNSLQQVIHLSWSEPLLGQELSFGRIVPVPDLR